MGEAKLRAVANAKETWPVKFTLTVADRYWLLNLLPREGDIITLRKLRVLREELTLTDAERKKFNVRPGATPNQLLWNDEGDAGRAFEFGPVEFQMCEKALKDQSAAKKLNVECVELYEKFCEKKNG